MVRKSLISIKQMNFSYKNHLVLKDVNGDFYGSKVYLLLGENGCGKSTFLKIIQKAIQSYTGEVAISSPSYGMVGSIVFYDNLSGRDNLNYYLCKYDNTLLDKFILEYNMGSYIDKKIKQYSLGMRQRLASVIVLLSGAKILLFDEPTNGMDYKAKEVFCSTLIELKKNDNCIIIASHNIEDFLEITDEFILIKDNIFNQVKLSLYKKYEISFNKTADLQKIANKIQSYIFLMKESSIIVSTEKITISDLVRKVSEFDIIEVKEYKLNMKDIMYYDKK